MTTFLALIAIVLLAEFCTGLDVAHRISVHKLTDRLKNIRTGTSNRNINSRQQDCTLPTDYPQSCEDNAEKLVQSLETVDYNDLDDVISVLNNGLKDFCKSECVDPAVAFLECSDEQDLADLYQSTMCGQEDGEYCPVRLLTGIESSQIVFASCVSSGVCDESCQTALQATADYLGCCASSLFENAIYSLYLPYGSADFTACGIDLGDMCSSASVIQAMVLLVAVAVIAAVYLSSAY